MARQIRSEEQPCEVQIYSKDVGSTRRNEALENSEFENYHIVDCRASILTLIQKSRLLLFRPGWHAPLAIALPCHMNDPKTFLSETIRGEHVVLGNSTKVSAICRYFKNKFGHTY